VSCPATDLVKAAAAEVVIQYGVGSEASPSPGAWT